ncbi:MAG: hypothetical protein IPM29_01655 [Planctomycetes bacterium]|nr:hypothetical protein [Planctomycetota bacterium]
MLVLALLVTVVPPQEPRRDLAFEAYRAQLAAAESALRLGEDAEARGWLDATEPALRGPEWRLFDAALDASLASWPVDGGVYSLAVSPDGSRVACGRNDGRLELRDARTFELLASSAAHTEAITQLRFDRAGVRLVTCSFDRAVKVWSAADLAGVSEFHGHGYPVGGADFSPDGTLVASCSYERPPGAVVGTVHVWNAADGTAVRSMQGGRKPLVGLAFSPDGQHIAAGSWDFCAFVWPVAGGEARALTVPDDGIYNAVDGVVWAPDGSWLAAVSKDRTARVWSVADGMLVATLRTHTDAVTAAAASTDGAILATASADGSVRLWSTADWSLRATLRGHSGAIVGVAFEPAGDRVWSCARDGTVRCWDARTSWYGGDTMRASHATYTVRFSPDGARLASVGYDGRVSVWSVPTHELLASWQAHPEDRSCHMLDWSPDGARLYTGSYDGTVAIWDSVTREELRRLVHDGGLYWLSLSPDGRAVAVVRGKTVWVWDVESGEHVCTFEGHTSNVLTVNWSADSSHCVSCGRDGRARVWDARNAQQRCEMTGVGDDVAEAVFCSGDTQIVAGGRDGHIATFDAHTGARQRDVLRNRHGLDHLALSPDGSRLVLASDAVTFVDLAHGGVVGRLRPHADRPYHVAFDRAGLRLASCSTDRTIAILDPRPLRERLADRAAALASRAARSAELAAALADGRTLRDVLTRVRADAELPPADRAAWIEALTLRAAE